MNSRIGISKNFVFNRTDSILLLDKFYKVEQKRNKKNPVDDYYQTRLIKSICFTLFYMPLRLKQLNLILNIKVIMNTTQLKCRHCTSVEIITVLMEVFLLMTVMEEKSETKNNYTKTTVHMYITCYKDIVDWRILLHF